MDWFESCHGLALHDEAIFDEEVEPTGTDGTPLVLDSDRHLTLEGDASQPELDTDRLLVHRLEETRSEVAMDLNGRRDDDRCQSIKVGFWFLKFCPGVLGVLAFHLPGSPAVPAELRPK